jgi:hypothetical protein
MTWPPQPPDNTKLCRVYGTIVGMSLEPLFRRPIGFVSTHPDVIGVPTFGGGLAFSDKTYSITDKAGRFSKDLVKGSFYMVEFPFHTSPIPFTVPEEGVADLQDWLFPYPKRIYWAAYDPEDLSEELQDEDTVLSGTEVTLVAEFSNGTLRELTHLALGADPTMEEDSCGRLIVAGNTGDQVLLTSGTAGNELWSYAGYPLEGYPQLPVPYFFAADEPLELPGSIELTIL